MNISTDQICSDRGRDLIECAMVLVLQVAQASCTEEEKERLSRELREVQATCSDKTQQLDHATHRLQQLDTQVCATSATGNII